MTAGFGLSAGFLSLSLSEIRRGNTRNCAPDPSIHLKDGWVVKDRMIHATKPIILFNP